MSSELQQGSLHLKQKTNIFLLQNIMNDSKDI